MTKLLPPPGEGHVAQGDPANPLLSSVGHETAPPGAALSRKEQKKLRPRVDGILAHRHEKFRFEVERLLLSAAHDEALKRYAFLSDEELDAATYKGRPLTAQEKRIARAWETSKKEAPMAIHASHELVVNAMRAQQVQPGVTVNVERAVIRIPDTKPDSEEDPIVIDVEATLAPG